MKSNMFEPIQTLDEAKDSVSSICVSNYEIITSSIDGKIRTYDIRSGKLKEDTIGVAITSLKISNDGNCMLCSCLDETIKLLDKSNGELLNEYKGHKNASYKVEATLSYDDGFVVSGSEDNNVYIWDLVETKMLAKLKAHAGVVCGLAYHPKDHLFVSSSFDGTLRVWK